MKKLYIGKYFSDDPSGRFYTDGDGSGEEFREEVLKVILDDINKSRSNKKLIINIDENVEGYGSSFFSEAFGGLIKYGYFEKKFVLDHIDIEWNDPDYEFYKSRIIETVSNARYSSKIYSSTKKAAKESGAFIGSIDKSFVNEFLS